VDAADEVRRRVVDPDGQPVRNATVASIWTANGYTPAGLRDLRQRFGNDDESLIKKMYSRTGVMCEFTPGVRSDAEGYFRITEQPPVRPILIIDEAGQQGAVFSRPNVGGANEIQLQPLVKLRGRVQSDERDYDNWSMVNLHVPSDVQNPLGKTHIAMCGTLDGRITFLVPPGIYYLSARTDAGLESIAHRVVATGDVKETDAGVLPLLIRPRIKDLADQGKWRGVNQRVGEVPPNLQARGVATDLNFASLKGKNVLLYFWSLNCSPCLSKGIPQLIKFHNEYAAFRDRFRIIAVCLDRDQEVKSLKNLESRLRPIEKNVWKSSLPFAIAIDTTIKNHEAFGLSAVGILVVIGPDGTIKSAGTVTKEGLSVVGQSIRDSPPGN